MKNTIRRLENAHVAFWLIKDYSWCTSTKWLALAMIGPTLAFAIYIAYRTREHAEDCVHNAAICCWIAANVVWMIGEFYFADGTRTKPGWSSGPASSFLAAGTWWPEREGGSARARSEVRSGPGQPRRRSPTLGRGSALRPRPVRVRISPSVPTSKTPSWWN